MLYGKIYHYIFDVFGKIMANKKPRYKSSGIKIEENQPYVENSDLSFDIFYPEGSKEKLPVIFVVHGGGYVSGHKGQTTSYSSILAEHGFCVINMEYTKCDGKEKKYFANIVDEFYKMFDNVRQNEKFAKIMDFDRVFLAGDSAGAHVVTMIANIQTNEKLKKYKDENLKIKGLVLVSPYLGLKQCKVLSNFGLRKILYGMEDKRDINDTAFNFITEKFPPAIVLGAKNDFVAFAHENRLYKLAKIKNLCLKYYLSKTGFKVFHDAVVRFPFYYENNIEKIVDFCKNIDSIEKTTTKEIIHEKLPKRDKNNNPEKTIVSEKE